MVFALGHVGGVTEGCGNCVRCGGVSVWLGCVIILGCLEEKKKLIRIYLLFGFGDVGAFFVKLREMTKEVLTALAKAKKLSVTATIGNILRCAMLFRVRLFRNCND